MRRHRMTLVAVVASVLVAIVGACGGGGDGDAFDGETVRSSDGVLTLEVPAGAAAEGIEIEVTRIAEDELPPELRGVDGVVVVGYQLGPDGAQFSQPVTLTFRVDPADHGIDLPEGAVPLALLLTENAAGDLESLPGEVSYEDGEIVVRATVTHFSPAILVFDDDTAVLLVPREIELAVGGSMDVAVIYRDLGTGETIAEPASLEGGIWTAAPSFLALEHRDTRNATIRCTSPTDGWVTGAYGVVVPSGRFKGLVSVLFGDRSAAMGIKLAGDGKCNGPTTSPPVGSPTGFPAAPRSSQNTSNPVRVSGTSGSVGVNTNDCFEEDGPLDQCTDEIDIAGVSWGPVAGSPNLLKVTVGFVGRFDGPDGTFADIGIRGGEGTPLGTRTRLAGGKVICTYPGSDGPLTGESCAVNAEGEIEIVRNVSGLTGEIRLSIRSILGSSDSLVEDAVQIMGIERP